MRHAILALLLVTPVLVGCLGNEADPAPQTAGEEPTLKMALPIHVVAVGFDAFDAARLEAELEAPMQPFEMIHAATTGNNARTPLQYDVSYELHQAPDAFAEALFAHAESIATTDQPDTWLANWDAENQGRICTPGESVDAVVLEVPLSAPSCEPILRIDAVAMESWIAENRAAHGLAFEAPSYTVFVLNPHDKALLPTDTYHQYTLDDGSGLFTRENQRAWGGEHDFVFLDVAAAPSSWDRYPWFNFTRDGPELWDIEDAQVWEASDSELYENLGRHINDAATILWARKPIYPVEYAERYILPIYVVLDPMAFTNPESPFHLLEPEDVEANTDIEGVTKAFQDLVPWAKVEATFHFVYLPDDDPGLAAALEDAKSRSNKGNVDFGIVRKYVHDNREAYAPEGPGAVTYPSFAFWLDLPSSGVWAYADGDEWGHSFATFHNLADTFLCVRTDVPVCSFEERFGPPGWPLWRFILIHELGHSFGLTHPHDTSSLDEDGFTTYKGNWLWDSTSSAMTYRHYLPQFNAFDRDFLYRNHAVNLARDVLALDGAPGDATDAARDALDLVARGDEIAGFERAREARALAAEALATQGAGPVLGDPVSTVLELPLATYPVGTAVGPAFLPTGGVTGSLAALLGTNTASWPLPIEDGATGVVLEVREAEGSDHTGWRAVTLVVNDNDEIVYGLYNNGYDKAVLLDLERCDGGCTVHMVAVSGVDLVYDVSAASLFG